MSVKLVMAGQTEQRTNKSFLSSISAEYATQSEYRHKERKNMML